MGGALAGVGGGVLGGAGLGNWQKTPVEKAIRIAVQHAVKELVAKTPQVYFRHGAVSNAVSEAPRAGEQKIGPAAGRHVSSPVTKAKPMLPNTAIVKTASANLRESAVMQSRVVAVLKANTKLSVQAEENGWYLVQTDDQKSGWIAKSVIITQAY